MQDNFHVASLLGFAGGLEEELSNMQHKQRSTPDSMKLADILMKTLLRNLGYHTVSMSFNAFVLSRTYKLFICCISLFQERSLCDIETDIASGGHTKPDTHLYESDTPPGHLRQLLLSLQKHLLAFCHTAPTEVRISPN